MTPSIGLWMLLLHGKELRHRRDIENTIRGSGRGADGVAQVNGGDEGLQFIGSKYVKSAAPRAEIDFAIGEERGGPNFSGDVVSPIWLAGFGIETMEHAATIRDEEHAIV